MFFKVFQGFFNPFNDQVEEFYRLEIELNSLLTYLIAACLGKTSLQTKPGDKMAVGRVEV